MPASPRRLNPAPTTASATSRALDPLRGRGLRLGTGTTRALLDARGRPDRQLTIVALAGTNGKGSTAALLAAAAQAAGYRTGLYTSPALESPHEQVLVNGRVDDDHALGTRLAEIIAQAEHLHPGTLTGFEAMTVAAFERFAEADVDLAIVEAGLGGAGDATNAADPSLSILTTVGDDHHTLIGPTRRDIARNKAGILRAGRPAVIGWLDDDVEPTIRTAVQTCGADVRFAAEAIRDRMITAHGLAPQHVRFSTNRHAYSLDVPLLGAHQADNACLAVLACEALAADGFDGLDPAAITHGIGACRWPGRLEVAHRPEGPTLLLDSAHNAQGCRALAAFLATLDGAYAVVFGALRDKDADAMLAAMVPKAAQVTLVPVDNPRSWDPERWRAAQPSPTRYRLASDLAEALTAIEPDEGRLTVVCGSLALIGQARRTLQLPAFTICHEVSDD